MEPHHEELDVVIRAEEPRDFTAIRDLVAAAFGSPAEADLVEAIRGSEQYVPEWALVAVHDDTDVVGHVMVSYADLVDGSTRRRIAMLSPLAVRPDVHGRGVGSVLVRGVAALADAAGEPLIVLEGSPVYYSRFGFEHAAPLGVELPLPSWATSEAGQLLRLRAYDANLRGRVEYSPAFAPFADH